MVKNIKKIVKKNSKVTDKKSGKKSIPKLTKKVVEKAKQKNIVKDKMIKKINRKKIMVVDDEADIRNTVKTILETEGYNVIVAVNADDALKKFNNEKYKPALVLMDIMMPGTPVKEIIPKMKNAKIAYISVVRTSEAEKEDLMKSKNIVEFIQKPFDIKELVKIVKKLVK